MQFAIIIIIIIVTQGRVVNGERRHAEPQGGDDHPQLNLIAFDSVVTYKYREHGFMARTVRICLTLAYSYVLANRLLLVLRISLISDASALCLNDKTKASMYHV